ncbi:hypothetical protein H0H92_004971 [Tricholoma furcatifolium]|nr:hypothetical protein H0H92_004971 [Tricholoma furcatifolium]
MVSVIWSTLETSNIQDKLLEGIGAVSKPQSTNKSIVQNYQDDITAPFDQKFDIEAAPDKEEHGDSDGILLAVTKLCRIIRLVRSSPQRRESWFSEVERSMIWDIENKSPVLMLILDVKTRWSSTHQMLRHALDYRKSIDSFVCRYKDLRHLELSDEDWNAITLVASWLKSFRSTTSQMSATKNPMLSTTHAIYFSWTPK